MNISLAVDVNYTYIPLCTIETMQNVSRLDTEDAIADGLMDEVTIIATTFSGRTFTLSMAQTLASTNVAPGNKPSTPHEMWIELSSAWVNKLNQSKGIR